MSVRMQASGQAGAEPFSVQLSERSLTVSIGSAEVLAWDLGGRLYSLWLDGRTTRRGLSGRALEKDSGPGGRTRRMLGAEESAERVDYAAGRARIVRQALCQAGDAGAAIDQALARAARFDAAEAALDAARFAQVYGEVGMLPPDQYLALVLQVTAGCSFGTCTFCDLYQHPFSVKDAAAFDAHLEAVLDYLGDSRLLRDRSVFLGAANALLLPTDRLAGVLRAIRGRMPSGPRVCGFIDAHTGTRKTTADYRVLGELGLSRIYVGLESGHDPLLAFIRKPGNSAEAVATVRAARAAGISAGVIVMLGLGGLRYAEAHARDTADVLTAMALGAGDLIYYSELVEAPNAAYGAAARAAGIEPLDAAGLLAQRQAIEARARFAGARPKMAVYDVREFIY